MAMTVPQLVQLASSRANTPSPDGQPTYLVHPPGPTASPPYADTLSLRNRSYRVEDPTAYRSLLLDTGIKWVQRLPASTRAHLKGAHPGPVPPTPSQSSPPTA